MFTDEHGHKVKAINAASLLALLMETIYINAGIICN